ncbi:MAG: hypothetical protein ACJAW1_003644 [Glaciecola sp.]|jgi:hypothetical protein
MKGLTTILHSALILLLACLVLPASAKEAHSLISNKYPQCSYTIIDTVEVKSRIDVEANLLNPLQQKKAFRNITNKLHQLATKVNADQIVLVAKRQFRNNRQSRTNQQNYLAYSAELIKTCAIDLSMPLKIAKFNNNGMAQLALPTNTLIIENTFVIKAPALEKRKQPALQNENVSLKEGAYTVKLNDSLAKVILILGTPTVEIQISEHSQILMYGRQHSFEFRDKKLSAVNSYSPHFTSDLKNRLEFDDRLDDGRWQVEGKYTKQTILTDKQGKRVKDNEIVFQNRNEILRVLMNNRTRSSGSEPNYVVDSFRLGKINDTFYKDIVQPESLSILAFIDNQLKQEVPSFLISDIPYTPTMTAWITPVKRLYTFGQHVLIEAIGDRVTTINIIENLYAEASPLYKTGHWQIGQYRQGMRAEEARSIAGDNGSYFNEELEVIGSGITKRFYFYEQKNQVKLYGGEISFY